MLDCNETVTLYNRHGSGRAEGWKRTVLTGASWHGDQLVSVSKEGAASADRVVVCIPAGVPGYLPPGEWDPEGEGWTLRKRDVLVRGLCPSETPGEALSGDFETTTILSLSDNRRGLLPHFRIGGERQ